MSPTGRRFLVSVPIPFVGESVVYRDPKTAEPMPALIRRVGQLPTVADPLATRVDLVVFRPEPDHVVDVPFGPRPGAFHRPARCAPITAVITYDDDANAEVLDAIPAAPDWYRQVLGLRT